MRMLHSPTTGVSGVATIGELVSIQYLRGIAAMMVVVFHLQQQLQRMDYSGPLSPGLAGGVDIFFVMSGFIIWVTTCRRRIAPWTFWKRRIRRIVPLYWFFTSIVVAVMMVAPAVLQTSRFDPAHVVASYFFVAWLHPVRGVFEPALIPGWALNYEMFFYLIFTLFLSASVRWRLIGTVGALLALVAIGVVVNPSPRALLSFYTSSLLLEFVMGLGLGWIWMETQWPGRAPRSLGLCLFGLGLALLILMPEWFGPPLRFVVRGIPAALVLTGVLIVEAHRPAGRLKLPRALGDASYSIYLSHTLMLSAIGQLWRKCGFDHLPGGLIMFSLAATTIAALTGWMVYRYIEQPMTRLAGKVIRD